MTKVLRDSFHTESIFLDLSLDMPSTFTVDINVPFPVRRIVFSWSYSVVSDSLLYATVLTSDLVDGNAIAMISKRPDFAEGGIYNIGKSRHCCSVEYKYEESRDINGSFNFYFNDLDPEEVADITGDSLLSIDFYAS